MKGAAVTVRDRGFQHDTDILIRQVDSHLIRLRASRGNHDIRLADQLAASLRRLIVDTTRACAADRARVREAVHFFVLRRDARHDRLPVRSLTADQRVINEIAQRLGRDDLVVDPGPISAGAS